MWLRHPPLPKLLPSPPPKPLLFPPHPLQTSVCQLGRKKSNGATIIDDSSDELANTKLPSPPVWAARHGNLTSVSRKLVASPMKDTSLCTRTHLPSPCPEPWPPKSGLWGLPQTFEHWTCKLNILLFTTPLPASWWKLWCRASTSPSQWHSEISYHQHPRRLGALLEASTAWNEAYIMLVSCIDYALDMTCIWSVSQCFIVGGIL